MRSLEHFLASCAPNIVNPGGEEVWCDQESDLVLIRLKPGTKSELYHHFHTKEVYTVLYGQARFFYGFSNSYLKAGQSISMTPPYSHQVFNEASEEVVIAGRIRIPWAVQIL